MTRRTRCACTRPPPTLDWNGERENRGQGVAPITDWHYTDVARQTSILGENYLPNDAGVFSVSFRLVLKKDSPRDRGSLGGRIQKVMRSGAVYKARTIQWYESRSR